MRRITEENPIERTNRREFEGGGGFKTQSIIKNSLPITMSHSNIVRLSNDRYRKCHSVEFNLFVFIISFYCIYQNKNVVTCSHIQFAQNNDTTRAFYPILRGKDLYSIAPPQERFTFMSDDPRVLDLIVAQSRQSRYPNQEKKLPIDGNHSATSIRHYLPSGPPPIRPSMLMLGLTSTTGVLDKLKRTSSFKRIYKSKVYHMFIDVLQKLTLLVDRLARKKVDFTNANLEALKAVFSKLTWKGGNVMKLKWPMAMLNPQFLKEVLSTPTFLVMLFHAVEVAYLSMPTHSWLKPFVKLVTQPSPEKEEQIWWRRKRLYDTLNGRGSSELQPNMKTIHFRRPGLPTPIAFPSLVNLVRQLAKKPPPIVAHYQQPVDHGPPPLPNEYHNMVNLPTMYSIESTNNVYKTDHHMNTAQQEAFLSNQIKAQNIVRMPGGAPPKLALHEGAIPELQFQMLDDNSFGGKRLASVAATDVRPYELTASNVIPMNPEDWLTHMPSQDQLMSQTEFDSLDEHERELVIKEAQNRFEESKLTNDLIKQHSDYIDSITDRFNGDEIGMLSTRNNRNLMAPR